MAHGSAAYLRMAALAPAEATGGARAFPRVLRDEVREASSSWTARRSDMGLAELAVAMDAAGRDRAAEEADLAVMCAECAADAHARVRGAAARDARAQRIGAAGD